MITFSPVMRPSFRWTMQSMLVPPHLENLRDGPHIRISIYIYLSIHPSIHLYLYLYLYTNRHHAPCHAPKKATDARHTSSAPHKKNLVDLPHMQR